jgi:ectoine hydroxylase-related dioxygenase (phytanoyl-CoA dioxygenase family)
MDSELDRLTAQSPLGADGFKPGLHWETPERARKIAWRVSARGQVVKDPHLTVPEVAVIVRRPAIIEAVSALIGPDIAVEGGFLMCKQPGADFVVPWHQDGINDRIELDPTRSVTLWAALTDATTVEAGALEVIPGSWRHGYLPLRREEHQGAGRGRALTTDVPPDSPHPQLVPVPAGQAFLMDVRLLHHSGSNTASTPRIGLNIRYVTPGAVTSRDGNPLAQLYPVAGTAW